MRFWNQNSIQFTISHRFVNLLQGRDEIVDFLEFDWLRQWWWETTIWGSGLSTPHLGSGHFGNFGPVLLGLPWKKRSDLRERFWLNMNLGIGGIYEPRKTKDSGTDYQLSTGGRGLAFAAAKRVLSASALVASSTVVCKANGQCFCAIARISGVTRFFEPTGRPAPVRFPPFPDIEYSPICLSEPCARTGVHRQ